MQVVAMMRCYLCWQLPRMPQRHKPCRWLRDALLLPESVPQAATSVTKYYPRRWLLSAAMLHTAMLHAAVHVVKAQTTQVARQALLQAATHVARVWTI